MTDEEKFHELTFYTLAHPDTAYFIHQHAVDAFTAQTADASTKPISITFALAGLCLFLEKNKTGREVQRAHMELARNKRLWPRHVLPASKGDITIQDVLNTNPGPDRDTMIRVWCESVWKAYVGEQAVVRALIGADLKIT